MTRLIADYIAFSCRISKKAACRTDIPIIERNRTRLPC